MAHVLTISINANDEIEIKDATGIEGGDLKVTSGDSVKWINATGRKCKLKFKMLSLGKKPGYGPAKVPLKDFPGDELEIPELKADGGTIDKSKVSSETRAAYVKYDVHVSGHGKPLDPIIIIEK